MAKFSLTSPQESLVVTKAAKPEVVAGAPATEEPQPTVELTPSPPVEVQPPQDPEKRFRVLEDAKVKSRAAVFIMRKDKIISSHGYDIAALRSQNVKLEEVPGA